MVDGKTIESTDTVFVVAEEFDVIGIVNAVSVGDCVEKSTKKIY